MFNWLRRKSKNRFDDNAFTEDECEVLEEALLLFTNYIIESDFYGDAERGRLKESKNVLLKELLSRNYKMNIKRVSRYWDEL